MKALQKYIYVVLALLAVSFSAHGQFRMVSNGMPSWSTINDSTYSATIAFQADLTGNSYTALLTDVDNRVFTPLQGVYRVTAASGKTVSGATLTVVRVSGTGAPSGQVMVFDPAGRETAPQVPFGSTGATAQLQAAVVTWNSAQASGGLTTAQVTTIARDSVPTLYSQNNTIPDGRIATTAGAFGLQNAGETHGIQIDGTGAVRVFGAGGEIEVGDSLRIRAGASYGTATQMLTGTSGFAAVWADIEIPYCTLTAVGGVVTWNIRTCPNAGYTAVSAATFVVTGGNDGDIGALDFYQDPTGGRVFDLDVAGFIWEGGVIGTVSTDANATDSFFLRKTGANYRARLLKDFKE